MLIRPLGRSLNLGRLLEPTLQLPQGATVQGRQELHHTIDRRPVDGVQAVSAVAPFAHQFRDAQEPQVVRDTRPAHRAYASGNFADRRFSAIRQEAEDLSPRGIG
jgi:hypothetical protein